jgi:hypothetical protein
VDPFQGGKGQLSFVMATFAKRLGCLLDVVKAWTFPLPNFVEKKRSWLSSKKVVFVAALS